MGKLKEKAAEYHEQFAARIIKALQEGTAPWQKPWKSGERILPHNFQSGRDYRGGNAVYLALNGLDRGYADPRWGGYRQIQEAGGHVRKGEKGTPIMYVEWRARRTARAEQGNPVRDEEGRPKLEWQKRDRTAGQAPLRLQRRADRGLQLRSLETAGPEWEGARAGRGADQEQRRPGRPRRRRPRVLQPQGRPGGAAGAQPVRVGGRLHAHGPARAGARHRAPEPPEAADSRRPGGFGHRDLRPRGAAGRSPR